MNEEVDLEIENLPLTLNLTFSNVMLGLCRVCMM